MSILVNPNDHSRTGEASTILFPSYAEFAPKVDDEQLGAEGSVQKHAEHDQKTHGSWAGQNTGSGGSSDYKISRTAEIDGLSKQGSIETTPRTLDKLFGKGEIIEGDEFERKVTEQWSFEMKDINTDKSIKATIYDFMRYDELNLTEAQGQTLAPLGRSETYKFSVGASSKENAQIVTDYINQKSNVQKAESVRAGDMVSWNSSGGRAQGKIIRVIRDGKFKVPNSSFTITGTPEEPAAEIRLYRGGEPTQTIVGHKIKTLTTLSKSQPSMGQVSQGGKPPKKKENYR